MDNLLNSMSGMKPTSGGTTSSADIVRLENMVRALQEDVKKKCLRTELDQLRAVVDKKADKTELKSEADRLDYMIDQLNHQVQECQGKQIDLKRDVDMNTQMIGVISKKLDNLKIPAPTQNVNSAAEEARIREILDRLLNLENELNALKNDYTHWTNMMNESLKLKADIDTVKTLGANLEDKIDEVIKALSKQFADKNDTRKALKLLEKNLKHMYDLFMNKGGNGDEEEAMFTKKPLGGTSCASCAKDVIDIYGKKVDYLPWGKLPFRDPSDRIARVG